MRRLISAVLLLTVLGACSSSKGSDAADGSNPAPTDAPAPAGSRATTTTPVTTNSAATTTASTNRTTTTVAAEPSSSGTGSTSSIPAPSSTAPTTTVAPLRTLQLRGDGLDRFDFGAASATVVDGLTVTLGAPVSDETIQLSSTPADDGTYLSSDDQFGFVDPLARTVCWTGRLCAAFGGTTAESLVLRGWDLGSFGDERIRAVVATADGIALGVKWSDHRAAIEAPPGGCYSQGYGTTKDGIRVTLDGGTWSASDEDGTYVTYLPDPAQVVVGALSAGALVADLHLDC